MRQDVDEALEVSQQASWRHAYTYSDQDAWVAFKRILEETVLCWFHEHPGSEAASHMYVEHHFVALAFERLRQAVVQRQVICETFSEVLVYLRASLNGAILETLRTCSRPGAVSDFGSAEQNPQDATHGLEVWIWIQTKLFNEREQRLAYLLYHCGLSPGEIVRSCPQEWSDVHEVARLRRRIIMHFLQGLADHSPSVISLERG